MNTHELLNEICDQKRFHKEPTGPLQQIRNRVGDALLSAYSDEENGGVAHRVLTPKSAPHAVRDMFGGNAGYANRY